MCKLSSSRSTILRSARSLPIILSSILIALLVLGIVILLGCAVSGRIQLIRLSAGNRALDLQIRHGLFLRQSIGQYNDIASVKEIEDAIVHMTFLDAQFINSVAKHIHQW